MNSTVPTQEDKQYNVNVLCVLGPRQCGEVCAGWVFVCLTCSYIVDGLGSSNCCLSKFPPHLRTDTRLKNTYRNRVKTQWNTQQLTQIYSSNHCSNYPVSLYRLRALVECKLRSLGETDFQFLVQSCSYRELFDNQGFQCFEKVILQDNDLQALCKQDKHFPYTDTHTGSSYSELKPHVSLWLAWCEKCSNLPLSLTVPSSVSINSTDHHYSLTPGASSMIFWCLLWTLQSLSNR